MEKRASCEILIHLRICGDLTGPPVRQLAMEHEVRGPWREALVARKPGFHCRYLFLRVCSSPFTVKVVLRSLDIWSSPGVHALSGKASAAPGSNVGVLHPPGKVGI